MERLPSRKGGSTLDLDSTALLHEDGHQEGVRVGHTRAGLKPCLHPPRRRRGIGRLVGGRAGGKLLLDCPGYKYQALLTNLPESVGALQVWRDYHGRAAIEGVIKELRHGFGLPGLCCKKFFATEAALSLAVLTYNLTVLFARHLG